MNKIQVLLFLSFSFLSFAGCKYEDGPSISFRSAENRIKGEYIIDKFEVGGIDLRDLLKKNLCYEKLIFYKSGEIKLAQPSSTCGCLGDWALTSTKPNLIILFTYPDTLIKPLGLDFGKILWEIKRLTDDEINLTTNYENVFIKLNLKE